MDVRSFLSSIYLHDRACKSIHIDAWERCVSIEVDEISRIRDPAGEWNYYNEENIVDGLIVFTGVRSIRISPEGMIPDDCINYLEIAHTCSEAPLSGKSEYSFVLSIDSGLDEENKGEVIVEIVGAGVHLEDPKKPGVRITE